jgi:hypothetical protein
MPGAKTAREIKTGNPDYSTRLKELADNEEGNSTAKGEQVAANPSWCAVKVPTINELRNKHSSTNQNQKKIRHFFLLLFRQVWHGGCP